MRVRIDFKTSKCEIISESEGFVLSNNVEINRYQKDDKDLCADVLEIIKRDELRPACIFRARWEPEQ